MILQTQRFFQNSQVYVESWMSLWGSQSVHVFRRAEYPPSPTPPVVSILLCGEEVNSSLLPTPPGKLECRLLCLPQLSPTCHGERWRQARCAPKGRIFRREMTTVLPRTRLGKRSPMGALVTVPCGAAEGLQGPEGDDSAMGPVAASGFPSRSRVKLYPGQKVNGNQGAVS